MNGRVGLVEEGSLTRGQGETISFRVTDTNASVPVTFAGILPDLFAEGQGMVGTGSMQGDRFVATEVLAKHDETYMPRELADKMEAAHTKHNVPDAGAVSDAP